MAATHEHAQLLVQLMRWNNEAGAGDVLEKIFSPEFDPETATVRDCHQILVFGETVGTFVKHDLLDRELLLDLFWIEGTWSRVGPAALKARTEAGEPRLYENFEALVQ